VIAMASPVQPRRGARASIRTISSTRMGR
jgi:hypothetical protein